MLKVFKNLNELDIAAKRYELSQEILMENAAASMREFLLSHGLLGKKTLIVVGSGNNGADGLALSRMIPNAHVLTAATPQSELCKLQELRAKKLQIPFVSDVSDEYEIVIDAMFGSGQTRALDGHFKFLTISLNKLKAIKIAVDMPTGVRDSMNADDTVFFADFTVTFGAYKESLLADYAKDFVGEIVLKELGLPYAKYCEDFKHTALLLERSDFVPPTRVKKNCNKGDFGHVCVVAGEMIGASVIAAKAALRFGVGLATIMERDSYASIDPQIMLQNSIPKGANTLLIGQGLGNAFSDDEILWFVKTTKRCVVDADVFKKECIKEILELKKEIILTPHPKEFCALFEKTMDTDVSVDKIQKDRFGYAKKFCAKYKDKVLVLKGANTIIAQNDKMFVMNFGTPALAKGGSGDMLAGLIASLLAQGYEPLEAAKNGALAMSLAAMSYKGNDYSMTIEDLLDELKWL